MPSTRGPRGEGHCSFCGKSQSQVRRLVAGPGRVFICEECIHTCHGLLQEEGAPQTRNMQQPASPEQIPPPKVLYRQLSEYVIGQERAKKILSVAVYNHYKRSLLGKGKLKEDVEMQKSNILLVGPTGSGKTLLAQTLAKILDVPFSISDATSLTEAGYVGEDVENILLRLIQAADYNLPRAEVGIVYIDEIDKLARKGANPSITRDVSGEGVQQSLLKIIEGCVANVPPQGGRKHPYQDFIQINTEHILFICGGSFEGLEKIVEKRTSKDRQSMGFTARLVRGISKGSPPILQHVTPDDLLEYGFIPELVGRLPVTAALNPLDKATLIDVLTVPKNSIVKQFQRLFAMDGVELVFTDGALEEAAEEALKIKTGARGLRSIIEEVLLDVMYELPSLKDAKKCVLEAEAIAGKKSPVLLTASGEEIYLEGTQERSA